MSLTPINGWLFIVVKKTRLNRSVGPVQPETGFQSDLIISFKPFVLKINKESAKTKKNR